MDYFNHTKINIPYQALSNVIRGRQIYSSPVDLIFAIGLISAVSWIQSGIYRFN